MKESAEARRERKLLAPSANSLAGRIQGKNRIRADILWRPLPESDRFVCASRKDIFAVWGKSHRGNPVFMSFKKPQSPAGGHFPE